MIKFFKKLYWKLPIKSSTKENFRKIYHEMVVKNEEKIDLVKKLEITTDNKILIPYNEFLLNSYKSKSPYYQPFEKKHTQQKETKIIAYYLTQYHPNEKNDEWWGRGTTEWNNVNQAIPQFCGHYQPRKPGELGYYDLRLKENISRQVEIAKNYGVDVFCFYYYWFDGQRLLEKPLNIFLNNKDLDIQFCYCWANENWTKRFSGTDEGLLMKITKSVESYEKFIDSVLPDMQDVRYYTIDDKPVLSVYRPSEVPSVKHVLEVWRKKAKNFLRRDIYIIAVQERDTSANWINVGFDAETEFQPKQIEHYCKDITNKINPIRKNFSGRVYDYYDLVVNKKYLSANSKSERKVYPAVMPMWDNTPRRNHRGIIFHGSTPDLYRNWLSDIAHSVKYNNTLDDKVIFVNAWNEWGEGAYLEPDEFFGYAYLNATWQALNK